jgi:hypothetical protein
MADESLSTPAGKKVNTITLTETTELSSANSGTFYTIGTLTANTTITLPTANTSSGVNYKFGVKGTAEYKCTITASNAIIVGTIVDPMGLDSSSTSGSTNIVVKSSPTVGSAIELICDGTNWWTKVLQSAPGEVSFN